MWAAAVRMLVGRARSGGLRAQPAPRPEPLLPRNRAADVERGGSAPAPEDADGIIATARGQVKGTPAERQPKGSVSCRAGACTPPLRPCVGVELGLC